MNKYTLLFILIFTFIIGLGEGYYLHESISDVEIRMKANELLESRYQKLNFTSNITNISICGD